MKHETQEEHDDLWSLLGKARPIKASSAFSRNVLRRVRMEEPGSEPTFLEWLRTGWNWLTLTAACSVIALVFLNTQSGSITARDVAAADNAAIDEVVRSADFSVIENLDLLLAMDENDVWLEASLR